MTLDAETLLKLVEKLGLPLALVVALGFTLWRVCVYVVKLIEDNRKERDALMTAHLAALGQLGDKLSDNTAALNTLGTVVREAKDETARTLDRIEMRVQAAAARGFLSVAGMAWLAFALLCALAWVAGGCAHAPTAAMATAQVESAVQEQAQATGNAQADSSAAVRVHRGPRRVGLRVRPAADGGMPEIDLDVEDDAEEIAAGAVGAADAGAASVADAGASSMADAGAEAQAAPPASFWALGNIAGVLGVLAVIVGMAFLARKFGG